MSNLACTERIEFVTISSFQMRQCTLQYVLFMEVSKRTVCIDSEVQKAEGNVVHGLTAVYESEFDGCLPNVRDDTCSWISGVP